MPIVIYILLNAYKKVCILYVVAYSCIFDVVTTPISFPVFSLPDIRHSPPLSPSLPPPPLQKKHISLDQKSQNHTYGGLYFTLLLTNDLQ